MPEHALPRILLIVDEFQEFFVEDDRIVAGSGPAAGPPGPPGPGLRHARAARLADARRGLHPGPQHHRPDGGAHRLAVQRGRRPPDPERGQLAPPACCRGPARRSTTTPTGWSRATISSRSSGSATTAASNICRASAIWLRAASADAPRSADGLRGQRPRRRLPQSPAQPVSAPNAVRPRRKSGASQRAWLGEAMAINDLTAAPFRRHHGSNLLLIGQQEEMSLGMLATAVVSLAAQMARPSQVIRLQHASTSSTAGKPTRRLGSAGPFAGGAAAIDPLVGLARCARDHGRAERRGGATAEGSRDAAPSIYLVLFGVQRLRDLRRQEDDFSFMRKGEETANPAQQFATLLREGSAARHSHADVVRHAQQSPAHARPLSRCAS